MINLEQNSLDDTKYDQWQGRQQEAWEAMCAYCGACCGVVEGDPCEHLIELPSHKYACQIYETRFGLHKTQSGRSFRCVPIRTILHKSWPGDHMCAYK